jgi:xanthine dehydrogenase small subunit
MNRDFVNLYINGSLYQVSGEDVFLPLSSYLRYIICNTGTKVVCAEGDCGACSVLVCNPSVEKNFKAVNSCIIPVYLMDGFSVVTVEGLKLGEELSEVQCKMVENHASQCGFCTPGFVVAIQNLYENSKEITEQKVKNYTTGNLCRCTGYQPIINAAMSVDSSKVVLSKKRYLTKEIIKDLSLKSKSSFVIKTKDKIVYGPSKQNEVSKILLKHKDIRIVSSATDLGVVHNKEKIDLNVVVTLHKIKELYELKVNKKIMHVGAKIDLSTLQKFSENKIPSFSEFLNIFASMQIRNFATLVGNLANGSPIADTIPFLFVTEAVLVIVGPKTTRKQNITEFYLGYRKLNLKKGEWIKSVLIPIPQKDEKLFLYKISQRRDLDISTVNSAFLVRAKKNKWEDIKIAYGGVGPTTLRLRETESLLKNKEINELNFKLAEENLQKEINPISDVRASDAFRRKVSQNLFRKFCFEEGAR